jgi:hypothetical protein
MCKLEKRVSVAVMHWVLFEFNSSEITCYRNGLEQFSLSLTFNHRTFISFGVFDNALTRFEFKNRSQIYSWLVKVTIKLSRETNHRPNPIQAWKISIPACKIFQFSPKRKRNKFSRLMNLFPVRFVSLVLRNNFAITLAIKRVLIGFLSR